MGEKKGGKIKKFFLFAAIAGAFGAVMQALKRRRSGSGDDSEWQELPPPSS
jgi:hypothetical protein